MLRNNKLEIFENFEIDRNLPKYSNSQEVQLTRSINLEGSGNNTVFISNNSTSADFRNIAVPINSWGIEGSIGEKDKKKGWFNKWIDSFRKKKEDKVKTMTILNFFTSLATSLNDIKVLQDTAIYYEQAISNAAKAGQIALVEKLKDRLGSAKSELQLVNAGLTKYFVEEQVIDFYKKTASDKNLKLSWIKHFVKPIPSKILEVKEKLDQQFVFDNYVILHYDPNNDATSLTAEEKKQEEIRKKDPIIFGLISGSRRLYYVGDWIDEYCNLTLDVVVETLKERVNEVNNEKVKTYLDTGLRNDIREKLPEPLPEVDLYMARTRKTSKSGVKSSSAEKLRNLGKKKNGNK